MSYGGAMEILLEYEQSECYQGGLSFVADLEIKELDRFEHLQHSIQALRQ